MSRAWNKGLETASKYLNICLGVFDDAIVAVFTRVFQPFDRGQQLYYAADHLRYLVVPLLRITAEYCQNNPGTINLPKTQNRFNEIFTRCLIFLCQILVTCEDAENFVTAMTLPGGPDVFLKELTESRTLDELSSSQLNMLIAAISRSSQRMVLKAKSKSPSVAEVLSCLIQRHCDIVDVRSHTELQMIVQSCLRWSPESLDSFFGRLPKMVTDSPDAERRFSAVITPSLSALHLLSIRYKSIVPQGVYRSAFRALMTMWLETVFVRKPLDDVSEALRTYDLCPADKADECKPCKIVKEFIESNKKTLKEHLKVKDALAHLESLRTPHISKKLRWIEDDDTLEIELVKTQACFETTEWQRSQTSGQNILCDISGGDEEELKLVLGNDYEPFTTLIRGPALEPTEPTGDSSSKRPIDGDSQAGEGGTPSKRRKLDSSGATSQPVP
ncbi:hypothetical protein EIP91_002223 [Steccherinum ochraceum]|uniref:Uncharacterized protein n=1 Tax=Steccherinum ochraceum TaxID=92696 RepID=A0A4R0RTB7_9APHY|nr:hypothetical protein EIP91_002223 [Steccherinum ochraceum]